MSNPNYSLENKVSIVTGSRRGLGKAFALSFAEAGADVCLCDFVMEGGEMEETVKQIETMGRRALHGKVDITSQADIDTFVKMVIERFGRIDILVNNAGVLGSLAPVPDHTEQTWDMIMNTNLKGSFLFSRVVIETMIKQKSGNIINMASAAAFRAGSVYSVSKAGIVMLTRCLALSLAKHNIRVNAIAPYIVRTEEDAAKTLFGEIMENQDFVKALLKRTPMKRLANSEDVVGPALFLASDASKYITGHTLVVDGGFLA